MPGKVDIMIVKEVLEVDGISISGQLYMPDEQFSYPTVCICHGIPAHAPDPDNNENGYSLLAERFCRDGFAVFIFNFRGTRDSGGNFDMLGWTRDLKAVIDYLFTLPCVDKSRLSLLGFSGGAAVAIYVASGDDRVSCVAACACPEEFASVIGVDDPLSVIAHFRSIGIIRDNDFPPSAREWLEGFKVVSPIEYISGIAPRPLLLVHGDKDETVDISQALRLYDVAGEPKQLSIIEGTGHRLRQEDIAMTAVINWLKHRCQHTKY